MGNLVRTPDKREKQPRVLNAINLELSTDERKILRKGERGCSADLSQLRQLAQRAAGAAEECKAESWSIFPVPHSAIVYIEFYNVPAYGVCSPTNIYGKYYDPDRNEIRSKRLWFDVRPIPEWLAPSSKQAVKDRGNRRGFDPEYG